MEFQCKRCGKCCLAAGSILHITEYDVRRWRTQKRFDILSKIFPTNYECENCNTVWNPSEGKECPSCQKKGRATFYWLNPRYPPTSFAQLLTEPRCPFLKKVRNKPEYVCLIHETKPEACEDFPGLDEDFVTQHEKECIEWGCEGYKKWKKIYRKKGAINS